MNANAWLAFRIVGHKQGITFIDRGITNRAQQPFELVLSPRGYYKCPTTVTPEDYRKVNGYYNRAQQLFKNPWG